MDTHYIRRIDLELGGRSTPVSLDFVSIDDPGMTAVLDLVESEWGRPHDRKGNASRVLASSSRPLRGGHILLKPPSASEVLTIEVTVESSSFLEREQLILQTVDAAAGEWVDLAGSIAEAARRLHRFKVD